ncbi:MAG: hypothetical protein HQ548_00910 [Chloroflexi bacterium]|nr:hypothetical protein [Chloroflexota bacterium]
MIARRGSTRVWHFAHRPGEHCGAPETALHQATKTAVYSGLKRAVETGSSYYAGFRCSRCRKGTMGDLAAGRPAIHIEYPVPGGARPDIAVVEPMARSECSRCDCPHMASSR